MRVVGWLGGGAFAVVVLAVGYGSWIYNSQGVSSDFWDHFDTAKVEFDDQGIPTLTADSWDQLIEAQGFVEASARLWQMDVFRRRASGRLAEWFGEAAFDYDKRVRSEDRLAVVEREAKTLPDDEKAFCEAYARGVNRFIQEFSGQWGLEYQVLQVEPEPWRCEDSLLVVLLMADQLSNAGSSEVRQGVWKKHLPKSWYRFLFTQEHPWNKPIFGERKDQAPTLPVESEYLPEAPLALPKKEQAHVDQSGESVVGSNNWVYRGKKGAFLSNDPHLGQSVPGIWYLQRLRISADEWAVGVSIPGLPGIILGMNPYLAWAFTNVGEDVDDNLREIVNPAETQYRIKYPDGRTEWRDIEKKTFTIKVGDEDRQVEAWFTHRGPLRRLEGVGDDLFYSRQWLPLKEGMLGLPSVAMAQSTNWEEFNGAIDRMRVPAQNVLFADRAGNLGYRASGVDIEREVYADVPMSADVAEWKGFLPTTERHRKLWPAVGDAADHTYMGTANERIWLGDPTGFASDDRKARIMEFLGASDDLGIKDMFALHLDTKSRFAKILLDWIKDNSNITDPKYKKTVDRWSNWSGVATEDTTVFTQAKWLEETLMEMLIGRVKDHYLGSYEGKDDLRYSWPTRRGWLLHLMQRKGSFEVFGTSDQVLADFLLQSLHEQEELTPYYEVNLWQAQHPFVGRVPVVDRLFKVPANEQYGSRYVVKVERPYFGASVRMTYAMEDPLQSYWVTPVGQSGHIASEFYANFRDDWAEGRYLKVFPGSYTWNFAKPYGGVPK